MTTHLCSYAVALGVLFGTSTLAADERHDWRAFDFVGLWEGIDPVGGDVALDSILPNDDGTFTILVKAELRSGGPRGQAPCGPSDRQDFTKGVYSLEDGALVSSNDFTIICGDGKTVKSSTPIRYEHDRKFDILRVFLADLPDPVNVLHRVSNRRRNW